MLVSLHGRYSDEKPGNEQTYRYVGGKNYLLNTTSSYLWLVFCLFYVLMSKTLISLVSITLSTFSTYLLPNTLAQGKWHNNRTG